jgi:hypothetical protein
MNEHLKRRPAFEALRRFIAVIERIKTQQPTRRVAPLDEHNKMSKHHTTSSMDENCAGCPV